MRLWMATTALVALPLAAQSQTAPQIAPSADARAPNAQGDVAVTIYQNGQSLVQDLRQLDLPAGRTRQDLDRKSVV